jgi:two-component system, NtrC family, sensor histidine kinase PilS
MNLTYDLDDSLASSKLRRFWLLTWLRVGLSVLLTISLALTFGSGDKTNNALSPTLIAGMYALASFAELWMLYYSRVDWRNQLFGQLLVDVILIGLMVTSLGGGSGGYAILFMMPIAMAASLMNWSSAMFICAVSVLSVLVDGVRRAFLGQSNVDWLLLGVLGLAGFALMSLLRFATERTERVEAVARQAKAQALLVQELSDQHLKEDTLGWVVLDEHNVVQLLNTPARTLAWQAGELLEVDHLIKPADALSEWLCALNQVNEQTIDWPPNDLNQGQTQGQLHIKASVLPHMKGYTALTLELNSSRTARNRDLHLATMGRLSASIAHEIRNPLAAISQATELLQESGNFPSSDTVLLKMLLTNTQRIDRIVHNLLSWSRGIQAHPVAFQPYLAVSQMAHDICISLQLPSKRLFIEPSLSNLPDVQFDEDHLYQILSNLLSNAARYASHNEHAHSETSIRIELRLRGRFVALLVLDDGEDVDANIAQHLFEPFQTASKDGTGLGLFLCREYAQANAGSLQLMTCDPLAGGGLSWVQAPYTKAFVLNMPIANQLTD